jgi:fibronectin type 3 domain-containing protein
VTTKTFTDTKAVSGKKYHYRIKAYDSKGKCIFTGDGRLRTCDLERPKVVLKVTEDAKVIVSWAAVKNAKSYDVYRSTSKDGTYKRVGSTAGTAIVDSGVTAGKTYYYKAKARHSDSAADSAYSVKKLITVEEPVIEEVPEEIPDEV